MNPYLSLLFSFMFIAGGDILVKKWIASDNSSLMLFAILSYLCGTISWLPLMKEKGLIISTTMWLLGTLAVGVIIGLYYGEPLSRAQLAGIVLGAISVVLLSI